MEKGMKRGQEKEREEHPLIPTSTHPYYYYYHYYRCHSVAQPLPDSHLYI